MRSVCIGLLILFVIAGCGGYGDYKHKSDRFDFSITFPDKWEVWDRSDDRRDFLVATLPSLPDAEIVVIATPVAPDISPNEIYLKLKATDERIIEEGMISCKNTEGRFIITGDRVENQPMKSINTLFLGERFMLEISLIAREGDFTNSEAEFRRMIRYMEL